MIVTTIHGKKMTLIQPPNSGVKKLLGSRPSSCDSDERVQHNQAMETINMSSEIKETAAESETETPVVVDKKAFKNLSQLVRGHIAELEASDKPAKKTIARFVEVQAALLPVRDLLRARNAENRELKEKISAFEVTVGQLQEIADNEPVKNRVEIRRVPSAFSGVTPETAENAPVDMFLTDSEPMAVASRIKPIVDVTAGVVGIKIFITDTVAHVVLFPNLIAVVEAREGRPLDIDADTSDALKVYLEGMTLAIGFADLVTKLYGAYSVIPLGSHKHEEASSVPSGFTVGDDLVVLSDDEDAEDEEETDETSDETESTDEPTAEEIARRLAAEEEDDIGGDE